MQLKGALLVISAAKVLQREGTTTEPGEYSSMWEDAVMQCVPRFRCGLLQLRHWNWLNAVCQVLGALVRTL